MGWTLADKRFMRRCMALARMGEGRTSPNPIVGAVVVKGGKIIGEGHHERCGGPHAEANALRGIDARGATLYVSLEPCSSTFAGKRTQPCVPNIIRKGLRRVVVAARDENPHVSGVEKLRAAGIRVDVGLFGKEAGAQNEAFFKFIKTRRPFVAVKVAQGANGKIGAQGRGRVRLSGKEFGRYAHGLRNRYDAILVGIGTILADDPRLTCRIPGGRNPARIILDSSLRIPPASRVLQNAKSEQVIIATSARRDEGKRRLLEKAGARVLVCGKRRVDLQRLVFLLPGLGIHSLLVEGGAKVLSSALASGIADKAVVAVSPGRIAEEGAIDSPFTPALLRGLGRRKKARMGADLVIEGYFR